MIESAMALYKYFKKSSILPNPDRPLSERVPSIAISSANKEVQPLLSKPSERSGSQGHYMVYTEEEEAETSSRNGCNKYTKVLP